MSRFTKRMGCALMGVLVWAGPAMSLGQTTKGGDQEIVVKGVQLQYLDAGGAAGALQALIKFPVNIMPIGGDRLVISGTADAVKAVLEKYIPAMDIPSPNVPRHEAALLKEQDAVVKTIRLNHVDAGSVAGTLQQIIKLPLPVQVAAVSSDRLVIRGSQEAVNLIAEKYVAAMDVPGMHPSVTAEPEFLRVEHYPMEEVLKLVRTVAPTGQIGVDEINRTLVVNAGAPSVAAIRSLLKQIDRPRQPLELQFYFVRSSKGGASSAKEAGLPQALQPIAKTLAENGFDAPTLMAPVMVTALESEKFESKSVGRAAAEGLGTEVQEYWIRGWAQSQPDGKSAKMRLTARLGTVLDPGQADRGPSFELETALTLKFGEFVILAVAPSSSSLGDAVALVVRASPRS